MSLHLYAYCSNDPIKYTDPTGHWKYHRDKAINYAVNHHKDPQKDYPVKWDCTGFVSRCLKAGKFKQQRFTPPRWFYVSKKVHSKSWYYPPSHYSYFSKKRSKLIIIKGSKNIKKAVKGKGIQKGDIMYIDYDYQKSNGVDHTTIIKNVASNYKNVYYYAHSDGYVDRDWNSGRLKYFMEYYEKEGNKVRAYIFKLKNNY